MESDRSGYINSSQFKSSVSLNDKNYSSTAGVFPAQRDDQVNTGKGRRYGPLDKIRYGSNYGVAFISLAIPRSPRRGRPLRLWTSI